jgi:L-amino acid N-acyltransferase YncA
MHELESKDYERVRPLYAEWRPYLLIFAVIDGICPGKVYVDDREAPRTALVWDHSEGELYLAGGAPGDIGGGERDHLLSRALNDCIRHRIRSHAEAHLPDLSEYTLLCDSAIWGSQLDDILDGLNPMEQQRKLYILEELQVDWRSNAPDGFVMKRIDASLFARNDLKGMDTMKEWLLGDWRTAADFAERETGFCLIRRDELVSWCASEHTCEPIPGAGSMCHVSIYTREGHRRQGFATLVAAATVEACLARGIGQIGWHCWDANVASAATAEKVGFRLLHDRTVYNGCWNQFDNLLLQAYYDSQANRIQEAVTRWEQAFEMWEARDPEAMSAPHRQAHPEIVAWCYYAAGQARARWGEVDAALAHLHKAVANGWQDLERLLEDEDLAALHDTPEWNQLLSRMADTHP